MNKSLKQFSFVSFILLLILALISIAFYEVLRYSSLELLRGVLTVFLVSTVLLSMMLLIVTVALYKTYKNRAGNIALLMMSSIGIRTVMPLLMFISGFVKGGKDIIREIYVVINNVIVLGQNRKFSAEEVLLLMPHCLQFNGCKFRITNDLDNCKNCGKCKIGEIIEISKKYKVILSVVTGGTAARAIVIKEKPKLILAVACERDLASAISDIAKIPVVGIINDRPYGPCFNTMIDVNELEKALQRFIKT